MGQQRPLRLIVSLPPRFGKSELVSHWTPIWYLGNWPKKRIILASHTHNFAVKWGRDVRNTVLLNPGIGIRLSADSEAKGEWETVQGGGMVAVGAGEAVLGRGADLFIIDDPLSGAADASSPIIRERVWEWWQSVARTRLEPNASVIVVMSRWDTDDIVGRLLSDGSAQWRYVELPALAALNDPIGRQVGESLWPARHSLQALAQTRRDVGEDIWAAQYQQRPNPQGRGYFFDVEKTQRLLRNCLAPYEVRLGGAVTIWKPREIGQRYVAGGDCAWGEKGAYSVVSVREFDTGLQVAELYGRLSLEETAEQAVKLCREYNNAYAGIERNGEGAKVAAMMVELGYGQWMYWHDHEAKVPQQPGWLTSNTSRPVMLADFAQVVNEGGFRPMCSEGVKGMLNFVRDEKGRPGPKPGGYADHVFAWGISFAKEFLEHPRFGMASGARPAREPIGWAGLTR